MLSFFKQELELILNLNKRRYGFLRNLYLVCIMILSQIVAISENFVIGQNQRLPWKVPDDTAYFQKVTMGHCVLMGRKNYLANKKALPGRTNIVISRDPSFSPPDAHSVKTPEDGILLAAELGEQELFIIGGGEIYLYTLPYIHRLYLTIIHTVVEGDTYYPHINFSEWHMVSEIFLESNERNPFDQTYFILEKENLFSS